VLDRVRAGADRVFDSGRTVRMRATRRPSMCASLTSTVISARSYCWPPTVSVRDITPPVAQNLMTSRFAVLSNRGANRIGSIHHAIRRRFDRRREFREVAVPPVRRHAGRRHDSQAGMSRTIACFRPTSA
jgi:hypothetical protein